MSAYVKSSLSSLTVREEERANQPAKKSGGYSIVTLSSAEAIRGLKEAARQLMPLYDPMLDPHYFLASLSKEWAPRVVVVRSGPDLVGIIYAKERKVWGIPTGIVRINQTLSDALLGRSGNTKEILSLAVESLLGLPRTLSVELKLPAGLELDASSEHWPAKSVQVRSSWLKDHHAHLALPPTYDEFLNVLGSSSRHNFRYYRRRFESAGHRYVAHLPLELLSSVTWELKKKCSLPNQAEVIERCLEMVAAADTPLAVGLQHSNGEWVSVAAGCYRPGQALVLFQLNSDQDFARSSLSVVLRSFMIENLIQAGCPELVIFGGTVPPLSRYVTHPPTMNVHVDKLMYSWRALRFLGRVIGPRLPKQFSSYTLRHEQGFTDDV